MTNQMTSTFDPIQFHAWVHNIDPFLIQFTETLGIRWYGLAYIFGFVAGALIMVFLARRGRRTLPADQVTDFITYIVLGTMIGGRFGYCLFYSTNLLTDFRSNFPYWGVLAVWEGGMASHGGIIGIVVACYLYARKYHLDWLHLGDMTTLGGAIGVFSGRVANFINGELPGRAISGPVSWAVKFPTDMHRWMSEFRPRLQGLGNVVNQVGVSPETWNQWVLQLGRSSEAYENINTTLNAVIVAVQSGNQVIADQLQPLLEARHPSQLYAALCEGLLVFIICFLAWRKPRKPGVIGALFLTLYAFIRILTETFRMPDVGIGFQAFGLTRGQVLSILMLIGSGIFLWWVARRPVEKIAGWGPEAIALKQTDEAGGGPRSPSKPRPQSDPKKNKKTNKP